MISTRPSYSPCWKIPSETCLARKVLTDTTNTFKRFAVSLFVLAGRNAYEFVRINLPGAVPSVSSIRSLLDQEEKRMFEGEFRFETLQRQFRLTKAKFAFCAEDCTAVVPQVTYDATFNSFVGLPLPLSNGLPMNRHYQTESLSQLETWFSQVEKSKLLNLHMIQPLSCAEEITTPLILSAYGTDSKYTFADIVHRWIWIYEQCLAKDVRIIGFATDGDPKYLKAMKVVSGLFLSSPHTYIRDRSDAFDVSLPRDWHWFFLTGRQLLLCFQDPIHVCTKLRNRLLSSTARMIIGNECISLSHLSEMIANSNKLNHGLVRSDIYPRDKQNFSSCEKISRADVIMTLAEVEKSYATSAYLRLIRSVIIAYIDRSTSTKDRIYHAWFSVFICRIWWAWILVKAEKNPTEFLSWLSSEKTRLSSNDTRRLFITDPSYQSLEMNAHQLTYLVLLVGEGNLPSEALQVFLFNSQTCENTFRVARSMSGTFSSIVNFSVAQFLRRVQKLSILNRIKVENEMKSSASNTISIRFPKHYKHSKETSVSSTVLSVPPPTKDEIRQIVSSAFNDALRLLEKIGVCDSLKKNKINAFKSLNSFIADRLNLTSARDGQFSSTSSSFDAESESESDDETHDGGPYDEGELLDGSDDELNVYDLDGVREKSVDGVRLVDRVNSETASSYFKVRIEGKEKFLHKQTACWLLTEEKHSLSADRVMRVMQKLDG